MGSKSAIIGTSIVIARRSDPVRKSPLQMHAEAGAAALNDAGVRRDQVGAVFTARTPQSYYVSQFNMRVVNELKVAPALTSEITSHGAGALGSMQYAAMALASGVIDYALCTTGEASDAWWSPEAKLGLNAATESDPQFERPYAPTTPSLYAMVAQRYLYETGATNAHMARVAVENRKWALRHPDAAAYGKGEITVDDVLASPMIATPLHRLDCATWYPGGIATAVVLTREDLAPAHRRDPIYIAGIGQCITHEWISDRMGLRGVAPAADGPNITRTGASLAARRAYEMAGLTNADVDVTETSSPFTFANLMMLEELGFCPRGEAGPFVEGGGIDHDGGRPFNTSGGSLSFGQSAQGLYFLLEAIDQLRGTAKGKQVANAKVALVHGHGGPLATHTVVLLSPERIG